MEKFKNMEDSFRVMSHEEMADVEGGLLVGLVVVGGVAIAGTFLLGAVDGASGAHAKRRGR
ncbi:MULTISPECIES: class IIb bacteriocin, lactobin A/cerein 7B family [Streptococcus]|uniref:class IIb bacteriocin, lactobin A/cerein 7B family n=1 Tax=Streptococcus TaxID=1301 RepID=UPI0011063253|nr:MULTISPECIES: class IIb bacteriocin, lactobin A/cerein 7B family [Streptococcus]